MAIPKAEETIEAQQLAFAKLAQLREQINRVLSAEQLEQMDTLSMGMSGDLEAAVLQGSTIVRVGYRSIWAATKA